MTVVLARSDLTRGSLRLFLTNEDGHMQDAFDVRWTVFSRSGTQISGRRLPAIRAKTGEYYAPWFSDVSSGNFEIEWEIQEESTTSKRSVRDKFYVVDPGDFQCCPGPVCRGTEVAPGGLAYLIGTHLSRGDLPLFLKDENGILTDAYSVTWTIVNASGCPVTVRAPAVPVSTGEYYADWTVCVRGGEYSVLWEFMRGSDSPLQSAKLPFSVLSPSSFLSVCGGVVQINSCGSAYAWPDGNGSCGCCEAAFPSFCCPPPPCTFGAPSVPVAPVFPHVGPR